MGENKTIFFFKKFACVFFFLYIRMIITDLFMQIHVHFSRFVGSIVLGKVTVHGCAHHDIVNTVTIYVRHANSISEVRAELIARYVVQIRQVCRIQNDLHDFLFIIIIIKSNIVWFFFLLFPKVLRLWACRQQRLIPNRIQKYRRLPNNQGTNRPPTADLRWSTALRVDCTNFASKTDLKNIYIYIL